MASTPTNTILKRLQERRLAAVREARSYAEREANGERLSATDETAFRRANADVTRLGKSVQAEIDREAEQRSIEESIAAAYEKAGLSVGGSRSAMSGLVNEIKDTLDSRAHGVYSLNLELPETRAGLLAGTVGSGKETVPTIIVARLYEKFISSSSVMSAGPTIMRTDHGAPIKLPRLVTLGGLTMANARRTEGATIQQGDATFDQVSLDAYKYAQLTQASRELIEDGVLDIEAFMGNVLGRNLANYVGEDLVLGDGNAKPRGVRTIAAANKVDTAAGGLWGANNIPTDFDKFFDVMALVAPEYRGNGKWLVNDQALFGLRKAKMNNVYAWEPSTVAGQPDTFLGYPILSEHKIPVPAAGAGVAAIFGDFEQYIVRVVRSIRVEYSTEYAYDTDLVTVKAVIRIDGDAVDDLAFAGYNSVA